MHDFMNEVKSPLFDGIGPEDRKTMLGCIGYHIGTFRKGDIVAFEEENIKHIGIIISGAVDMVKETRPCWCGCTRMNCLVRPLLAVRIICLW